MNFHFHHRDLFIKDNNHSQGCSQLKRDGGKPSFSGAPFIQCASCRKKTNGVKRVLPSQVQKAASGAGILEKVDVFP